jgi:signal transduction histidine kinase
MAVVDPAALQQVLGHLVENAVKYSPEGSQVCVGAAIDGDEAVLEVIDEGPGVPVDVDIFEPFQRAVGSEDDSGVGLGLYIVRNLVRSMGGTVTANRNAGVGSTFTVRLPRAGR